MEITVERILEIEPTLTQDQAETLAMALSTDDSEWRESPTWESWGHDGKGGLVCQHGNDVPGVCESCRELAAIVDED